MLQYNIGRKNIITEKYDGWLYNGKPIDENILSDYFAFVYLITNKTNNRKYIGKKLLLKRTLKQVKGKKKKILVESDWKTYWSSSEELKKDVEELGEENFIREITKLCKSKGEANYYELREQITNDVLLYPSKWYNSYVGTRVHRKHLIKNNSHL